MLQVGDTFDQNSGQSDSERCSSPKQPSNLRCGRGPVLYSQRRARRRHEPAHHRPRSPNIVVRLLLSIEPPQHAMVHRVCRTIGGRGETVPCCPSQINASPSVGACGPSSGGEYLEAETRRPRKDGERARAALSERTGQVSHRYAATCARN